MSLKLRLLNMASPSAKISTNWAWDTIGRMGNETFCAEVMVMGGNQGVSLKEGECWGEYVVEILNGSCANPRLLIWFTFRRIWHQRNGLLRLCHDLIKLIVNVPIPHENVSQLEVKLVQHIFIVVKVCLNCAHPVSRCSSQTPLATDSFLFLAPCCCLEWCQGRWAGVQEEVLRLLHLPRAPSDTRLSKQAALECNCGWERGRCWRGQQSPCESNGSIECTIVWAARRFIRNGCHWEASIGGDWSVRGCVCHGTFRGVYQCFIVAWEHACEGNRKHDSKLGS